MPSTPQPIARPSDLELAERAFRRPSSIIWLHRVRIGTRQFDDALQFYVGTLGLTLRTVELDPVQPTRFRAILTDAEARDVLELVEMESYEPGITAGIGALSFALPRRSWMALRIRLGAQDYPFTVVGDALAFADPDGLALCVEALHDGGAGGAFGA